MEMQLDIDNWLICEYDDENRQLKRELEDKCKWVEELQAAARETARDLGED